MLQYLTYFVLPYQLLVCAGTGVTPFVPLVMYLGIRHLNRDYSSYATYTRSTVAVTSLCVTTVTPGVTPLGVTAVTPLVTAAFVTYFSIELALALSHIITFS